MNFELGTGNRCAMQQVYSASWVCVLGMLVLFLVMAEIVGGWFLEYVLSIPEKG